MVHVFFLWCNNGTRIIMIICVLLGFMECWVSTVLKEADISEKRLYLDGMKYCIATILLFFCTSAISAQSVSGTWGGPLKVGGASLRFVLHLQQDAGVWKSKFDSPDQNAYGINGGETIVKNDSVLVAIPALSASFKGRWNGSDSILGYLLQGNMKVELSLARQQITAEPTPAVTKISRPQTPQSPFSYDSEDVEFGNTDNTMRFGGTLTKPKIGSQHPVIIIISGSGTQDRDGTIFDHKPYYVLADHLSRNGFAVLRVDDRGAGKSTAGDIANVTSEGLSKDMEAALDYLLTRSDIDKKRVALIGHSEGGIIAPMLGARRKEVAALILWAAPTVGGKEINILQNAYSLKQAGIDSQAVASFKILHRQVLDIFSTTSISDLDKKVAGIYNAWKQQQSAEILKSLGVNGDNIVRQNIYRMYHSLYDLPWMRFFITYDPVVDLKKINVPVLAIIGTKDTQVEAGSNLKLISETLKGAGNNRVTAIPLLGLNHLFQNAVTGDVSEYKTIQETISPSALALIVGWLNQNLK